MKHIFFAVVLTLALMTGCHAQSDTIARAPATDTPTTAPPPTHILPTLPPSPTVTATPSPASLPTSTPTPRPTATFTPTPTPTPVHPLSIAYLRQQSYPPQDLVIEQELAPGSNYRRYYASYRSEGLKIYGLLTIPQGQRPPDGWPVIIFNHGYIPPDQYRTTERYVAYVDGFARAGYIVFRPDYRGHDRSEGRPTGAYGSPGYTIDVLNAVAALKNYPDADPNRIGMWGHSMGGWITLRAMVVSPDIKAGVIWGGVVGAYEDLFSRWRRSGPTPTPRPGSTRGRWRTSLTSQFGDPEQNPAAWRSLSANAFLEDLSGPIQLHHARGDETVPVLFSEILYDQGQEAGMPIELYEYPGDNHNISGHFGTAMARSVAFFDRWLKEPVNLARYRGPTVFTGAQAVNLRAGPGLQFTVVAQMQPGDAYPIVGSNIDRSWWQVRSPQGLVWVAADVTLAAHTAEVPVTGEVAGPTSN